MLSHSESIRVVDSAVATIANSAAKIYDVSLRELKSIQFVASGISTGNGAFGIEVSNNGTNWVVYNRLTTNVANTNVQEDLRTAAPTLSANSTTIYFFPRGDLFRYIRVFLTFTTDGVYSAVLQTAG